MRILEERDELKMTVDRLTDDLDRKGKAMLQSFQALEALEAEAASLKRKLSEYEDQETRRLTWRMRR